MNKIVFFHLLSSLSFHTQSSFSSFKFLKFSFSVQSKEIYHDNALHHKYILKQFVALQLSFFSLIMVLSPQFFSTPKISYF